MATGPELAENYLFRNFRLAVAGLATEIGTATASSGAATCNDYLCLITTESLTTAQNAVYTLTLTNSVIGVNDMVFVAVGNGTNSAGTPTFTSYTTSAGSVAIRISNLHASAVAFNGTLKVSVMVIKSLL